MLTVKNYAFELDMFCVNGDEIQKNKNKFLNFESLCLICIFVDKTKY